MSLLDASVNRITSVVLYSSLDKHSLYAIYLFIFCQFCQIFWYAAWSISKTWFCFINSLHSLLHPSKCHLHTQIRTLFKPLPLYKPRFRKKNNLKILTTAVHVFKRTAVNKCVVLVDSRMWYKTVTLWNEVELFSHEYPFLQRTHRRHPSNKRKITRFRIPLNGKHLHGSILTILRTQKR